MSTELLRQYRDSLLKSDRRNRSVLFRGIQAVHNFDLATVQVDVVRHMMSGRSSCMISGEENKPRFSALRTLAESLDRIEEETGQHAGYVGFPFIQGRVRGDYVRGPLVLFPVKLERRRQDRNGGWYLVFGRTPIVNGALVSKIRPDLPSDFDESFNDMIDSMEGYSGRDHAAGFIEIASAWASRVIGTGPFDGKKSRIRDMTAAEIDDDDGPLRVVDHRVLGSFPQGSSEIYGDYGPLMEKTGDLGPVSDLLGDTMTENPAPVDLDKVPDRRLNTILDSDSSQDEVILEAKRSRMVLIQGPPGTGKSQVITNMVADALSNGKKVLVVCQKRAALDVVRGRLEKVGLGGFSVLLGKESADRKAMYSQLLRIMNDHRNYAAGQTYTPGDMSRMIDQATARLSDLGTALHRPYFGGATAQRIYSMLDEGYRPRLGLARLGFSLDWNMLDSFLARFARLEQNAKKYDAPDAPWAGRKNIGHTDMLEAEEIRLLLDNIAAAAPHVVAASAADHARVAALADTYVNDPGMLRQRRKAAAAEMSSILDREVDGRTASFIIENLDTERKFWDDIGILRGFFKDASAIDAAVHGGCISVLVGDMAASLGDFDGMRSYDILKATSGPGVSSMIERCSAVLSHGEDWTRVIRNEILSMWLDGIEAANPVLKLDHDDVFCENHETLDNMLDQKKNVLRNTIRASIAGLVSESDMRGRGRWHDLAKEFSRKRRVRPVRALFEKYTDEFLGIAPCWLASPEAVSRVFPLEQIFDLVIVDEASQLPVEESLPFLYRARRAVIAGDDRQLQPFDLFQVHDSDTKFRSLLDVAGEIQGHIQLSWHYRSRHQDLIDFSNHAFYGGTLQVAPNVSRNAGSPPIRHVKCDGTWDGRSNAAEAGAAIDAMHGLLRDGNTSIGVITFNDAQRDLIASMFERRLDTDADFKECYEAAIESGRDADRPFFKNIENVQGDERDHVIFSIGYARDPDGRFANRFGTLSMDGGENRLNVAITRAREGMTVLSSIEPSEISTTGKNAGPRLLRRFIEYADAVSRSDHAAVREVLADVSEASRLPEFDDADLVFENRLAAALEERGYTVQTQVGFSGYKVDVAVVHPSDPNSFILGIECDGLMFNSARGTRERDVMRRRFLEARGWTLARVWSRLWWRSPERVISEITDYIDARVRKEGRITA
ncbi:MAG: AAA domain-containing protein [Alphaproteobacteria bacterium]|nr:AAA domain-containing protein [Alphaproteobacteria bacterium]MDA8029731.1 AAA domain-containing protein [Alphaproteobacteria bacterium]